LSTSSTPPERRYSNPSQRAAVKPSTVLPSGKKFIQKTEKSALAVTSGFTIQCDIPAMKFLISTIIFISFLRFAAVAIDPVGATPVPGKPLTPHPTSVPITPHQTSIPSVLSVDADTITVQNGIISTRSVTHHDATDNKQKKNAPNVHTYKVTRFTDITINGHRMKLSDIKAGMEVRVTAGTDPTEASIIAAKVDRWILMPVH
jgi:hypothetical protein